MHSKLYIGTAGWTYKDWEGIVYPEPKPTRFDALRYLAQLFNVLEINSSFYRIPTTKMVESWCRRVEDRQDFLFSIKLWQGFTHAREEINGADVTAFKTALDAMASHQRLGAVLVQFPWSFKLSTNNANWLKMLADRFSSYPLAIEIRHTSWLHEDYFRFLKERKLIFCNIDQPLLHNCLEPTDYIFSDTAYIRFHGRNRQMWFKEDAGTDERYNYLYREEELEPWVERIRRLGELADKVIVITNNHFRGQAACNALQLRASLEDRKVPVPRELIASFPQLEKIAKEPEIKDEDQLELF